MQTMRQRKFAVIPGGEREDSLIPLDEQEQGEIVESIRSEYERGTEATAKILSAVCLAAAAASLIGPMLYLSRLSRAFGVSGMDQKDVSSPALFSSFLLLMIHVPFAASVHVLAASIARGVRFPPSLGSLCLTMGPQRFLSTAEEGILRMEGGGGVFLSFALFPCLANICSLDDGGDWKDIPSAVMWVLAFGNAATVGTVVLFQHDTQSTRQAIQELNKSKYRHKCL